MGREIRISWCFPSISVPLYVSLITKRIKSLTVQAVAPFYPMASAWHIIATFNTDWSWPFSSKLDSAPHAGIKAPSEGHKAPLPPPSPLRCHSILLLLSPVHSHVLFTKQPNAFPLTVNFHAGLTALENSALSVFSFILFYLHTYSKHTVRALCWCVSPLTCRNPLWSETFRLFPNDLSGPVTSRWHVVCKQSSSNCLDKTCDASAFWVTIFLKLWVTTQFLVGLVTLPSTLPKIPGCQAPCRERYRVGEFENKSILNIT